MAIQRRAGQIVEVMDPSDDAIDVHAEGYMSHVHLAAYIAQLNPAWLPIKEGEDPTWFSLLVLNADATRRVEREAYDLARRQKLTGSERDELLNEVMFRAAVVKIHTGDRVDGEWEKRKGISTMTQDDADEWPLLIQRRIGSMGWSLANGEVDFLSPAQVLKDENIPPCLATREATSVPLEQPPE